MYFGIVNYKLFNYEQLNNVKARKPAGKGKDKRTYADIIAMADTETSKKPNSEQNHVCAWTISLRANNENLVTLSGHRPSEFCECLQIIKTHLIGEKFYLYFHNLTYDWTFLRKFLIKWFGEPEHQLNTKSHYPIFIEFSNGLIIRDSLILAQRSLEKWAEDLGAEHKKAIGKWDYNQIRNQDEEFSQDELEYIEHDTLAGVECIQIMMDSLHKHIYSMPYTATGIPREDVKKLGIKNRARDRFIRKVLTYPQYLKARKVYHGGYTHANRHELSFINPATCYDFSSSYPFCLLAHTDYAIEKFFKIKDCSISDILKYSKKYCCMFKLILINPIVKNDDVVMPMLQVSKCVKLINPIADNGRILKADYAEIYLTNIDLEVFVDQYDYEKHICVDVEVARKGYLPRWFTDYIYSLYVDKTKLKGADQVLYAIAKSKLNSVYGMCVQASIRDTINEDYKTGEYIQEEQSGEELYAKYVENFNSILPYQWGVFCTALAMRNLFLLSKAIKGVWLYSDTDSIYATEWNTNLVESYNAGCRSLLMQNGYGAVRHNDRDYWLGIAELDGEYSEFTALHSKCYCCRDKKTKKLKITVAGVPKSGAKCLNNDIRNFKTGFVFPGTVTGKLTHKYIFVEDIYIDENGNETGDSINLEPCDYLVSSTHDITMEDLLYEELEIQVFEEDKQMF